MNDYDRLQYYENCYDSFCSDFAIPRAQTSQSINSRPSSGVHRSPQPCSQFQASKSSSSSKNNGLLLNNSSNHVYYFDSFSDAFSPLPGEDESRQQQKQSHQNHQESFPALYEETDAESLSVRDDLKEGNPQSRNNVMHLSPSAEASSLQQLQFFAKKNKGPTPPPKPRQALALAQPPLPPTATTKTKNASFPGLTKSSPELFHDHQRQRHHSPHSSDMNPNMEHHSQTNNQRHLHQSFENIPSCPIPPPPKYIRAPNNSHFRHMSVEMLPSYSIDDDDDDPQTHRKLSQQQQHPRKPSSPPPAPPPNYRKKEVMSLSDFLKLSSATVFKKAPFSSHMKSGSSPMLCGHLPPSNDGAISSSPTPSTVSSIEAGGGGGGSPSRSSVVPKASFRKKCGVTKRRKKIDESLFTPHTTAKSSSSCEVALHGGVNTGRKSSQNSSFLPPRAHDDDGDHTATVPKMSQHIATTACADSARYSITSFGTSQANVLAEGMDHHHRRHHHDKDDHDGGGDDDEGITFMAETNHDTDFELDPLPEKEPDDVMDFSWAPPISQPPAAPAPAPAFLNNNNKKENLPVFHPPPPPSSSSLPFIEDRRNNNPPMSSSKSRKQSESKLQGNGDGGHKPSKSNSAGVNGRPSSRCSLIINSLMGHLSGRNKSGGGSGAGAGASPHQYSHHSNDIHNNNNLPHQVGGRDDVDHHDHDDRHHRHHPHSSQTFGDDPITTTKPKSMLAKKSFQSKLKKPSNNKNDRDHHHLPSSNAKSHYHRMESPRPPPPPPPTLQKSDGRNGSQSNSNSTLDRGHRSSRHSKGLSTSSEIINKNEPPPAPAMDRGVNGMLGTSVWGRPRSIAAFNLDSDHAIGADDADDYDDDGFHSFHPPSSGSKSLGDINFGGHYHNNDNYGNGSFPNLANVIGCIPRVSLSNNMKKCGGGTRQYESGCGTAAETFPHERQQHHHQQNGGFANNSKIFQESAANAVETVADYQRRRRTCCGGGLFGDGDPIQMYDDDKYDKYYGEYSLTGLNIPMINNSDLNGDMIGAYTNTSSNYDKPTEEVVLDRYYAHCNKVVRRKESQPSKSSKSGQQQKKNKGESLSEKIWRNVSLPIINSTSCGNNNDRKDGTNLCDHQRAKQIEECFQCLSQREEEGIEGEKSRTGHNHQYQHHSSNHNRKQQQQQQHQQQLKKDNKNRRKTKSQSVDYLDLLGGGKNRETERSRQRRRSGGRDLEDNSGHHRRDVAGRTKLKKVSSSNSTSSGCSSSEASHCINPALVPGQDKQKGNVQRFHHHNHQVGQEGDDFGDEVIEDLSSSSCFSYSLQNGCSDKIKPKPPNATGTKFKLKTTSVVSSNGARSGHCLNSTTTGRSNSFSSSTTDDDDDGDEGHDSELDNVALVSANKIVASVTGEDYQAPKRMTVKAKTSCINGAASTNKNKAKTNSNPTLVQVGASCGGKGERTSSTRTGNKSKSNDQIATTSPDYDDDVDDALTMIEKIDKKKFRQEQDKMHLLKALKRSGRGKEAMVGPISRSIPTITTTSSSQEEDDVDGMIIEDSSSAISSLPTSSSSTPHLLDPEDVIEGEKVSKDGKKNRVKWTFITNGLAKATRKLSISGSRSSLGSSIVGSDLNPTDKKEKPPSSRRNSIIEMVGGLGRRRRNDKVGKEVTATSQHEFLNDDATKLKRDRSTTGNLGPSSSEINLNKKTAKSTEKLNKCKDLVTDRTKRRHTTDVFFRAGRHTGVFLPVAKTATLRRNPSRKQRAATVQVTMPHSMLVAATPTPNRISSYETHQAHQNPSVFMKKKPIRLYPPPPHLVVVPPPPPKLVKVVGIPVSAHQSQSAVMRGVTKTGVDHHHHRSTMPNSNVSSVFSAFSTSSCNSSTSGSNRSSTSGYTSNVSRRTSAFLKSFRKRWAKKNNKVADGDEEDAHRTQHDPQDDDDDDDDKDDSGDGEKDYDNDEDAITFTQANRDKHSSHRNHNRSHKAETGMALGTVNKLGTIRRKRRTPSTRGPSKHAIFSTFYIGPVIKDPMEEEVIYVTKDFDDVTLDLTSGEVKKTSDGTLLFTADPLCFASRKQLKKKREKLAKLNRKLMLKDKQTREEEERTRMKNERRREKDKPEKVKQPKPSGSAVDRKGKTNNKVISPARNHHHPPHHHKNPNRGEEIHEADNNPSLEDTNSDDGEVDTGTTGKPREVISASTSSKRANCNSAIISCGGGGGPVKATKPSGNSKLRLKHIKKSAAATTTTTEEMEEATTSGKSNRRGVSGRSIISPRLIKSYLGISKDLLVGANGKNQSADDLSGNGGGEEPDTPTRSLLSRLKDSSRSGFGFSSNASSSGGGGGGAASRSSSKKRGSSSKQHDNGLQVSQTDSPKKRSSLSDSSGALGSADDGNDPEGVSGKLSTGHHQHHHQPSCSSEEELTSINSCEARLSSLTLGTGAGARDEEGEYNGPFQGRAVAIVDCLPSPYDRNALRYKKGDIIDIIAKKPTGLWTGKVNSQIGYFKFINVELIPNPSTSSTAAVEKDDDEDDDDDAEDDDVLDEDDSAGDYADTSNYTECSLHYGGGESTRVVGEGGVECSCPSSSRRVNDVRRARSHHQSGEYRGNSQRLAGAPTNPWEVEQRQSVANVINGYGASAGETRSKKRGGRQHQGKGDPLGILNVDGEEVAGDDDDEQDDVDDEDVDGEEEDSQTGDEVDVDVDEDDDDEEEENDDEIIENELCDGESLNQAQMDGKRQLPQKKRNSAKAGDGSGSGALSNKKGKKQATGIRRGRPTSVGDLLQRINLEHYTQQLVQQGFETLDILKDLEEEDLDAVGILNETDRSKILRAVEFLRIELEDELDRHIPGQSLYQYRYYQATLKKPSSKSNGGGVVNARGVVGGGVVNPGGISHVAPNGANNMSRLLGKGSPVTLQQTGTGLSSPHFYRLHHPRDSGIFVGKGDGEEDGDEVISGADLSCAESHPDVETEEIILSPINLQKTSSSSGVVVPGGRAGVGNGNPNPASWHPHHLHNNNNKQGSHHHINRFISKGGAAPPGVILSGSVVGGNPDVAANSTGQTAQQPTSSASSSGSSSSSSGIATAGDSFWNSVSSSSNTNSNGSSSSGASSGAPASSVVVDQNHSQWSKQGKAREHHRHRRDASPAYNTESQRNRFLHAKSLFEPTNGATNPVVATSAVKSSRVAAHVYENGVGGGGSGVVGVVVDETVESAQSNHLHLQRVGSQGKSLTQNQQQQQQQNRFIYCEKSSDSGISVCTNSPPPLRNEFRN